MQLSHEDIACLMDCQRKGILQKTLSDEQLALIYRNRWFKMWVPTSLGGLGLHLSQGLSLLEELAYWDGGLAWTVTLCAGANLFVGYIDPAVATDLFVSDKVCLGGSGQIAGIASREGSAYRLKGHWKYATGAPHLTHFTLNAFVYDQGKPLIDNAGNPISQSFFVSRDHVLVHYDWDTFGLEATASHSFSLDDVLVPENHSFQIDGSKSTHVDLLYQYPFIPFAELTLLANFMGMYRRFLDLMDKLFVLRSNEGKWQSSESKAAFRVLDRIQQDYSQRKISLLDLAADSWENLVNGKDNSPWYDRIADESRNFVDTMLANVIKLYPHSGIAGAATDSEINIVFRNIFTASQHRLLQRNLS
ncbi:acyl-CoA dehydrogenase family protein [Sphingobacterium thalpophilum]|uniref:acyl-CoA dehydrogenase n=1 Tax=Sphingobacterium thalpophilum TaxID=259 RepID=UPI002D76BD83|nr:acyl-CoA dehydrogenase [Sphingobacterium thalpophilum]